MNTINLEILKRITSMSKHVASDDPIRPYLTAICLDVPKERREIRLRATNGHMMSEVSFNVENLPEMLGNNQLLIYPPNVKRLELLLKEKSKHHLVQWQIRDNSLFVEDVCLGVMTSNVYPNTDAVKPKLDDYTIEVGLNAEYLLDIVKAAGTKSKNVKLRLSGDKLKPIIVDVIHDTTPNNYALVMPVRI